MSYRKRPSGGSARLLIALVLAAALAALTTTAASAAGPDVTPPTTTASATVAGGGAAGAWENRDVSVTLRATDNKKGPITTYRAIDGGPYELYTGPVAFPAPVNGSNDGLHTLSYYSVDKAGNQETPKQFTIGIDTSAPDTSLVVHQLGANPSFSYDAIELSQASPVAPYTFQCRVSSADAFASCPAGGKTYSGLADGSYQFAVRAADAAGNVDATPAESQPWTSTEGAAETVFDGAGTLTTDPGTGATPSLPNVASVIVGDVAANQRTKVGIGLDTPRAGDCAATYKCFSPQTYVITIAELVNVSGTPVYHETFRVDAGFVPSKLTIDKAMIFHDGTNVPNCNNPFPQSPSPGPMCVESRRQVDGDWEFGIITLENGRIRM